MKPDLEALRSHLFDSLERVKSLNDPNTDENEKMSLEQAESICEISEQIIETYKVQVQAMAIISKAENYRGTEEFAQNIGLLK